MLYRNPFAVKAETFGTDIPFFYFFPKLQASGCSSDESVTYGLLCPVQFVQHIIQPVVYGRVAGSGIHHGKCGNVMSADVSVQSGVFPVGIAWGFGSKSGFA